MLLNCRRYVFTKSPWKVCASRHGIVRSNTALRKLFLKTLEEIFALPDDNTWGFAMTVATVALQSFDHS